MEIIIALILEILLISSCFWAIAWVNYKPFDLNATFNAYKPLLDFANKDRLEVFLVVIFILVSTFSYSMTGFSIYQLVVIILN